MKHLLRRFALTLLLLFLAVPPAQAGYAHYFTWHKKPDNAKLRECVARMGQVVSASRSILAGPEGEGGPIVNTFEIEFNGQGEEQSHEPFIFPGTTGGCFCKTNGKPYDAAVTACLIVARDHFPADVLEIKSDGSWGDWEEGKALYRRTFSKEPSNPMGANGWDWGGGSDQKGLVYVAVFAVVALGVVALIKTVHF